MSPASPPFADTLPLLSAAEHAQMLDDIAQVCLAVATRAGGGRAWDDLDVSPADTAAPPCPRARLGFLCRALPVLAQACAQIAHAPPVDLRGEGHRAAPPERARRVAVSSLLRAVRAGHAGRWVEETVSVATVDTSEARAVRSFVGRLRRDADTIAAIADAAALTEIAADARRCAWEAQALHGLPLWENGADDPDAWTATPTERMQRDPALGRVCGLMRGYRRVFAFDWEHPLFALPAREQWQLYEVWGLFQTLRALLALGAQPRVGTVSQVGGLFATRQTLLSLRLAVGEASRLDLTLPSGDAIALFYQRVFPAGLRSRSRTLQPDICLQKGEEGAMFLLDPKYKPYAAPGDEGGDMDQMHAYRDAIAAPGGGERRPVQRAWCLYAGGLDAPSRPMIAYGLPAASIVGALHLRPGDPAGFARLCELLRAWLLGTEM